MKRKMVMKIALGLILPLIIALPSYSADIKAMHENQPVSGKAITSDSQGRTITKPAFGLQSIRIRGLKMPVIGIAAETASGVVKSLINTGSLDTIKGLSPEEISGLESRGTNVTVKRTMVDKMGNKHIRTFQKYLGLTVVGAEIIVHIDKQNRIFQINGKYLPAPSISVRPSIEAETALQIGLDEQQGKPELRVSSDPELVIYGGRLAYFYVIEHKGPDVGQWLYYVDAQTGKLLFRYNNIQYAPPTSGNGSHQSISGNRLAGEDGSVVTMEGWLDTPTSNYFMYNFGDLWGIYDVDVPDWEQQDTSSSWDTTDRAAVSAGNNFATVQDYVSSVIGFNSFDNAGAFARANVHEGTDFVNAYWDGTDFHFGDGDGVSAGPLTTLDIVAHEYGHALTDYSSDLFYAFESGALNESYSDIVGSTIEFYAQPDGRSSYPSSSPGYSDWLIGEDCWLVAEALRNMRDPMSYNYPSYYRGTYWIYGSYDYDYGGVHINSSALNFAFYLLAEGGTGTNDGNAYNITGIGIEEAAEVAINANLYYHTSLDQYSDARQAWISAATTLGYNVATVNAVFDAIGVFNGWHQPVSYPNNNLDLYANQDFPANDSFNIFIADDFVCAETWVIQEIFVPGGLFSGGTTLMNATALHFEIYANNAGVPDGNPEGGGNPPIWSLSVPPTDSQITINNGTGDLPSDVTLSLDTLVSLSAGTYWLVFYPEMQLSVGGQYGRNASDTTNGYHAQVINPGGGFGFPTTWTPVTSASTWNLAQQDFAFRIDITTASDIDVSPTSLNMDIMPNDTDTRTLNIGNIGNADLIISDIGDNAAWLSQSPTNGTVSPGGNLPVLVTFNSAGMSFGTYNAAIEIQSNDPDENVVNIPVTMNVLGPGTLQFSSATYSVSENGGTATISVTRTNGSLGAVSIDYTTSDGTASDGSDYTLSSGTLTWNNGDATAKAISVSITDDTNEESNETVNLTLSNPQGGATLGTPGAAVLTITDNDSTATPPPAGGGGGGCFISTAAYGL